MGKEIKINAISGAQTILICTYVIEHETYHAHKWLNVNNLSLQCYSVLSDILVKNELCIPF